MRNFLFVLLLMPFLSLNAQQQYWQQGVEYNMDVTLHADNHQMTGEQKITYYNNSPDTITQVFYHLFYNAFQPNSMMDVRSRSISDPDRRIGDRIASLDKTEIGFHNVLSMQQDGVPLTYVMEGTILEVGLAKPILPGQSTVLEMSFRSQVPVQIRRTGRNNAEGIDYSMSQWYPKLCEYDEDGWHTYPYIQREFYGVWGDFNVNITMDESYVVAAGGELKGTTVDGGMKTWMWKAENVHDFMWAADPDYVHTQFKRKDGIVMNFYYQPGESTEAWKQLPEVMDVAFDYINKEYGQYPYPVYNIIQGGDGGMEYPMGTLITGHRNLRSLVGVSVHELMHSWYQMVLGTNEALYAWMDEGFTSYASAWTMNHLRGLGLLGSGQAIDDPVTNTVAGYVRFNASGNEEPLTTHSDHFKSNTAYSVAAYTKGSVFLHQIRYIVGEQNFKAIMLKYFDKWKFKHPDALDFIRVAEKESGIQLDWFAQYFINTTYVPDYAIDTIYSKGSETAIQLSNVGDFPMPVDVTITTNDSEQFYITIPLRMMRGSKHQDGERTYQTAGLDWPWTHSTYTLVVDIPLDDIKSVEIDDTNRMVDGNRSNNSYERE